MKSKQGFTLIELLVVVGIIGILTTVTLFNYRGSDYSVSLDGMTQQVALAVRQAQVYATSVREYNDPTLGKNFTTAYGAYFSTAFAGYVIYAQPVNSDGTTYPAQFSSSRINCTVNDRCIEQQMFKSGYKVSQICTGSSLASLSNCSATEISIQYTKASLAPTVNGVAQYAKIHLTAPDGTGRDVIATPSGEVNTQ